MKTPKQKVKKVFPTAISQPPNPRGMYYDQWTIIVPPTSAGIFGLMNLIIGHGKTVNKAWANAAESGLSFP